MVLVDKEVEAEEVGGSAGGRAEQDMGRVRQQGGAGFRWRWWRWTGAGVTRTKCLLNLPLCPTKPTQQRWTLISFESRSGATAVSIE